MLKGLRETVKRLPIGGAVYDAYMKARYHDGEILDIHGGPLEGWKWVRYTRIHNDEYIRGDYEPTVQGALIKLLKPGMTFYDVGANAGYFTLLGSKLVGDKGSVVSFEPHPKTAHQLRHQISVNGRDNATVVVKAVSDSVGTATFSDDTAAVMASLITSSSGRRSVQVETTTLDMIVADFPIPDLLKIDIEGAEIFALNGARNLIAERRPVLLVEVHSHDLAVEYDKLMNEFGYRSSALDGGEIQVGESGDRFVLSQPYS